MSYTYSIIIFITTCMKNKYSIACWHIWSISMRNMYEETAWTRTIRTPAFWGTPPPAASWLPTLLSHVGSQVKTRSNDLEDIGQGQRSSHATHLLMLVIICINYGENPSRTIDTTEQTRFSRSRPNDLESIGQGQRSLHATHPLMLMIICAKYGKNTSRIVDFFSRKNPSWTIDATGRTRKVNGQTDRQTDRRTDGQTDRQTGWIQYTPPNFIAGV